MCLPGYHFTAEENRDDEHCRLQLLQHFCCYFVTRNELMNANHRGKHSGPGVCVEETGSQKFTWEPVCVTTAEYIDEIEMYVYVRTHVCVYVYCHYCMSPILRLLVGTNHGLVVMDTRNNVVTQVMATDSKLLSVCVCVCVRVCVCVCVTGSSTKFSWFKHQSSTSTIRGASAFF